jgi:Protein of unknown function (DUF3617)
MNHRVWAIGLLGLAAAAAALAQPATKPGLWEVRVTRQIVNGQDMTAQMQAAQAQMAAAMKSMPPEQRKMMESRMGQMGMGGGAAPGAMRMCLTADMLKDRPPVQAPTPDGATCEPMQHSRSGNTFSFSTRCKSRDGMVSEMQGKSTMVGDGEFHADMINKTTGGKQSSTMESSSVSKWLGADCGNVKPLAAAQPAR